MSKIINTKGIKPGCIYRIALENFVTYKQVELFPGPSLNLIIGPNGTGKSTFVCAIILGLCGKTNVIGRSKKISDYVRSGCDQATVEIELYRETGQRNVIITRNFNLEGVSTWYIDHKTTREKQVQEVISALNIQVDNLCQLLPQDRVQDFSKMDPQQLLRSTLSAVGGQESVAQLDELIRCKEEQNNLGTKVTNNGQMLQEQIRLNERLKGVIDAMQERRQIENDLAICEKKKLWLEYNDLRAKVVEYNNDKQEATKLINKHKTKMRPLENVLQEAKTNITDSEQKMLAANREKILMNDKINDTLKTLKGLDYKLKDLEASYQEKLDRHKNREQEIKEVKVKLEKLVNDKDRLVEVVGDETKVKMDLAEILKPMQKTIAAIEQIKKQKLEVQYDLENNLTPQIRMYQNKIKSMDDVGNKRLQALRAYSEDSYEAVMWYRQNKDIFQHAVHEPMVLEINFKDPKFGRYLESTVSNRDLVAFTFESSRDMNLFLKRVRGERGLRMVNAICSQPSGAVYDPPCPIDDLSYLGFYTYLVDTISAPPAIERYLCRQYGLHRIPIGNDHTFKNSGKVPSNITYFFTENHRFTIRVSAYSGAKSSSTIEIRPAKLLANTVEMDKLNKLNQQLSKFEKNAQSHRDNMKVFDTKLSTLEEGLNVLYNRRKKINEGVEQVKTLFAQIRLQNGKLRVIENEPALNIHKERALCSQRQRETALQQCLQHRDLNNYVKTIHSTSMEVMVWKARLEYSRNAIVKQESQLRELRDELRNVTTTLENIEALLKRATSRAKEKLIEAKQSSDNKLPQDPNFPYKEHFERLPSSVNALQEHCCELQTRIELMDEAGDDQVIKEYENREKLIKKLKFEVDNSSNVHKILDDKMKELRAKWLPPLEALLRDINVRFEDMFAKLGCAGEVKLDNGGGDEEYARLGVAILVRFRESEQLRQLTRHAQSGGERALTTALYLMALQRLTTVPFRCVDEINQGMDPVNERKMFQLLVKVTTDCDNAQYFLLTPKLLTQLEYNDKIMVHTIMNGKRIMHHKKWTFSRFLESARRFQQH